MTQTALTIINRRLYIQKLYATDFGALCYIYKGTHSGTLKHHSVVSVALHSGGAAVSELENTVNVLRHTRPEQSWV